MSVRVRVPLRLLLLGGAMDIKVQCWKCSNEHIISVEQSDHDDWQNGQLIQDALHYLTDDERELLMSATCGECWDILFGEDETDG